MTRRTTTETIGRTFAILALAALFAACGDSPAPESSGGGSAKSPSSENVESTKPALPQPLCTAIRDGEFWTVHVTLPTTLPDGAKPARLVASSKDENHTLEYNENLGPIIFMFSASQPSYEIKMIDDQGREYVRKGELQ